MSQPTTDPCLGHFFEMSKVDAERAMAIYRTFTRQTDQVVQYLSVARQFEHHTRVEVPKLKHAPVNLGKQLEEYLNDEDFEVHRRQYLAEQEVKKTGGSSSNSKVVVTTRKKETTDFPEPASNNPFPTASSSNAKPEAKPQANKGPDPDLIDFFDSIEQNQTPLQAQPQQQANTGFQQPAMGFQSTNGFAPMAAPQPTGFASNGPFQQQATGFVQQPQSQAPQLLQPSFTTGFGGSHLSRDSSPARSLRSHKTPSQASKPPALRLYNLYRMVNLRVSNQWPREPTRFASRCSWLSKRVYPSRRCLPRQSLPCLSRCPSPRCPRLSLRLPSAPTLTANQRIHLPAINRILRPSPRRRARLSSNPTSKSRRPPPLSPQQPPAPIPLLDMRRRLPLPLRRRSNVLKQRALLSLLNRRAARTRSGTVLLSTITREWAGNITSSPLAEVSTNLKLCPCFLGLRNKLLGNNRTGRRTSLPLTT